MNTSLPDLGDLLRDAVDGIEPGDRLDAIRDRTSTSPRSGRRWWYAAGGAALATAATVAAFAVVGTSSEPSADRQHAATTTPSPSGTQLVAAYFVGDGPRGDRLFREFDRVPAGDPLQAALDRIESPPSDPDYRTPWTPTSFGHATVDGDTIEVEVGDAALADDLAVQQVVYTLQAAVGKRLPVSFREDGGHGGAAVSAAPMNDVLNLVNISDPTEGLAVHGRFTARGVANSFEANVPWQLRDEHGAVVRKGFATATGTGDRLYPWQARVDVRGLPFGFYTFVASTDDPSGGEGGGPDSDTRTIIVR